MTRPFSFFPTIPQSGTISGIVDLKGADLVGVWSPEITSGNMFVQVSFNTTSADFKRVLSEVGSAAYQPLVGPGNIAFALSSVVGPFPHIRFETDTPQTDVRTLVVVTKL